MALTLRNHFQILLFGGRAVALTWMLLLGSRAGAQDEAFEKISVEDGLSQSSVFAVHQDRLGFMWFGTANGLNRFDGYSFTDYRHDPNDPRSICNDWINAIYEDGNGALWIGTRAGLSKMSHDDAEHPEFVNYCHDPAMAGSLASQVVTAIREDRTGVLWVGGDGGLDRFDPATGRFENFRFSPNQTLGLSHNQVSALHEDRRGNLWIGTLNGLDRFSPDRTRIDHFRNYGYSLALQYPPGVLAAVDRLLGERGSLAALTRMGNGENACATFFLEETAPVLIVGLGEWSRQWYDHGRIESGGQVVWEMEIQSSRHGGGAVKNRLVLAVVHLDAGEYQLDFRSDDSHGFATWNELPPHRPEWWGIRLLPLNGEEAAQWTDIAGEYYLPSRVGGDRITALAEDGEGFLWIGTVNAGLTRMMPAGPNGPVFENFYRDSERTVRVFSEEVRTSLASLQSEERALASILRVGDDARHRQGFTLKESAKVLVVYTGQAIRQQLVDIGWLEGEGGELWRPTYEVTGHAGGFHVNRTAFEVLSLDAGSYALHYLTDERYGHGNWHGQGPTEPETWGIRAFRLEGEDAAYFETHAGDWEVPMQLAGNTVTDIRPTGHGRLWVATTNGLSALTPWDRHFTNWRHDPFEPRSLSTNNLSALFEDHSETLWVGTVLGGINKRGSGKNRFRRFGYDPEEARGLKHALVYSFCEDRRGWLWVGTDAGISVFDREKSRYLHFGNRHWALDHVNDRVLAMMEDRHGWLWAATENKGLFKLDPTALLPTGALSNWEAAVDADHSIWVQYVFQPGNPYAPCSNNVRALLEDASGRIWVGSGCGLMRYHREEDEFTNFGSLGRQGGGMDDPVRCLFQDRAGMLWLGTDGSGLVRFDPATESFTYFRADPENPRSLSQNVVTGIYEDDEGFLWVATYGGGLNRLDPARRGFERFSEENGLPNNVIYGILADRSGNLWLSSNKGLTKFDPKGPAGRNVVNFGIREGLQSNEFNTGAYLRCRDGDMVFGGINGYNIFQPDRVAYNPYPPPVVITGFKKFGREVKLARPISKMDAVRLSYKDNFISFSFAALDYTFPEKNRYAFKLEGFHEDWIESGTSRQASFANLHPGTYTFRVKGANNDGVWNETGASFKLEIVPPFWQTWWFRFTAFLGAATLIAGAFHYRVRHLRREKELQQEFSKQLIRYQERERQRIAAELHDSLGQNLLVIGNELQLRRRSASGEEAAGYGQLAGMVVETINEVREIAYNLHPHQLDRLGLKKAVTSVVNKVAHALDTEFVLDLDEIDDCLSKDAEINFYRIVQEAVANVVKHAGARRAWVRIRKRNRHLVLTVRDDGRGFGESTSTAHANGFGLTGIAERVKLMGGVFRIRSARGRGALLLVKIPMLLAGKGQ